MSIAPLSWKIIIKGSTLAAGFQAPTHSHLAIYMNLHYRLAAKVTKGPKADLVMKASAAPDATQGGRLDTCFPVSRCSQQGLRV